MNLHFYQCDICGKVLTVLSETEVPTVCCGKEMKQLIPNTTDGATEKHVPVAFITGQNILVQVGSTAHPMTDSHFIEWIGLETDKGFLIKNLHAGDRPEASFALAYGEQALAVYAYCNLHGLWCAKC